MGVLYRNGLLVCIFIFFTLTNALNAKDFYRFNQNTSPEIYLYCKGEQPLGDFLENACTSFNIKVYRIDRLDKNNQKLHIILDAFYVPFNYFPENYILFQTLDLEEVPLTKSYLDKMKKAVAAWDASWKNIGKYSLLSTNFCFFSESLIDPLILPCLIPVDTLDKYRSLLSYSNSKDTDISSHSLNDWPKIDSAVAVDSTAKNPRIAPLKSSKCS
jgi:hypothetical protein